MSDAPLNAADEARRQALAAQSVRTVAEDAELTALNNRAAMPDTVMVPNPLRDETGYGVASHLERINPGPAAAVPWAAGAYPAPAAPPADRGPLRPYVMLAKGTHNGVLYRPGSTVMLYDDEAGPQHRLLPGDVLPAIRPVAVTGTASPGLTPSGLSPEERERLRVLRALPALDTAEAMDEECDLAAREHFRRLAPIDPKAVAAATEDEAARERARLANTENQPTWPTFTAPESPTVPPVPEKPPA